MSRMRNATNRTVLFCLAAVLLGAGAVLASATGPVRDRLPAGWPRLGTDRVWLDGEELGRWRDEGWWTPAVIAALSVAVLLLAALVLVQVRRGLLRELALGQPEVTLSGPALAAALAERAGAIDGVDDARVRLRGNARRLRARITLTLRPDTSPDAVLHRLAHGAVAEARAATAPRALDADVRLTVRSHRARRLR
ncbi:hypothetical protein [Streptomyces sp. NPDC002564]|uniref:hypothetical protein n=1 Tax=Streptomyces sp. NPDC002564 TaxID=3364649 RepID=UPI0036865D92